MEVTKLSPRDCNLGPNICRLFRLLAQLPFPKSETELDYYRVASQAAKRLKTYNHRKLGIFTKIPKIFGTEGKFPTGHLKGKFWQPKEL